LYGGILGSGLDLKKQKENKLNLQRQKESKRLCRASSGKRGGSESKLQRPVEEAGEVYARPSCSAAPAPKRKAS